MLVILSHNHKQFITRKAKNAEEAISLALKKYPNHKNQKPKKSMPNIATPRYVYDNE